LFRIKWRTPHHPDPPIDDGTDCALLRKMAALIVGVAAVNVLAGQRARSRAQERSYDVYRARAATQQLIQDYQNGICYRPDDDDIEYRSPLNACIRAISARSSVIAVLQMALGRNQDNTDLKVQDAVTRDLLGPVAQLALQEGECRYCWIRRRWANNTL
jgi:hypothetical protein